MRLCTGRTSYRRSRGIALLFHDHGTRRVWGVSVTPRPFFTPEKDSVPIVQEAGWAPRPVRTGAEILAPHRDSILDRPVCSQSLYQLRYLHGQYQMENKLFGSKAGVVEVKKRKCGAKQGQTVWSPGPVDYLNYFLTPWIRVLLEKLTSKLCS
jgi:hypothetical protein